MYYHQLIYYHILSKWGQRGQAGDDPSKTDSDGRHIYLGCSCGLCMRSEGWQPCYLWFKLKDYLEITKSSFWMSHSFGSVRKKVGEAVQMALWPRWKLLLISKLRSFLKLVRDRCRRPASLMISLSLSAADDQINRNRLLEGCAGAVTVGACVLCAAGTYQTGSGPHCSMNRSLTWQSPRHQCHKYRKNHLFISCKKSKEGHVIDTEKSD